MAGRLFRLKAEATGLSVTTGLLVATLTMAAGCAVGPKYHAPDVAAAPAAYQESDALAAGALWAPAQPKDGATRGTWWTEFNDSVLDDLLQRIDVSNQTLKGAEAQLQQARALVRGSRAAYYPTITTTPQITATHVSNNRASNRTTFNSSTVTDYLLPFDLSYEVDLWGRVRSSVASATAGAQATAADLESVRLSLRAELAADYFDLRALDSERTLLDSTVGEYEQALKLTQLRHDAGIATGIDIAQAQTQLESTRATATDLAVQRAQLEHAIAVLVGAAAPSFSLPSAALADNLPAVPAGLPSQLLERRPDVAAAERRTAAANATIGVARSAFFPSLMLNASGGFESTSLATWLSWPSHLWSLGPALAQTLFDGGARRAAVAGSEAAYDAAVASYRESVLTAFQEVEDSLSTLSVLRDEAQQQEAAVTAAQRSLTLSLDQYKGGVTPYLQVITAQNALLSSQRVALDIQHRRLVATVQLVKALGGGWTAPRA